MLSRSCLLWRIIDIYSTIIQIFQLYYNNFVHVVFHFRTGRKNAAEPIGSAAQHFSATLAQKDTVSVSGFWQALILDTYSTGPTPS